MTSYRNAINNLNTERTIPDNDSFDTYAKRSDDSTLVQDFRPKIGNCLHDERVNLKATLDEVIALSRMHSRRANELEEKIENIQIENKRLIEENDKLRSRATLVHNDDSMQEQMQKLEAANSHRSSLEADNVMIARQRDYWKREAEELTTQLSHSKELMERTFLEAVNDGTATHSKAMALEVSELVQKNRKRKKIIRSMKMELNEWKKTVEELGIELNEEKRQHAEIRSHMTRKEAETMEMMNALNAEMSIIVNQKNQEMERLVKIVNQHEKGTKTKSVSMNQFSKIVPEKNSKALKKPKNVSRHAFQSAEVFHNTRHGVADAERLVGNKESDRAYNQNSRERNADERCEISGFIPHANAA